MAIVSAADLEGRFQENDAPTSADFAAVFDSFLHKVSAAGTALAVRSLGAGAVGSAVFATGTTAAARDQLALGSTTAAAQQILGGGAAGRTMFEAATTASARQAIDFSVATTAQMSGPTNTSSAFVTPGLQHYHPLHPKAWVTFNGVGTVSIKEGWNMAASVGDLGTGSYRVSWGSAFANSNYGIAGLAKGIGSFSLISINGTAAGNPAVGDVQIITGSAGAPGQLTDLSTISVWAISR